MPELPEVETVVRDLRPQLHGRRIASIQTSRRKLRRPWSRKWNKQIVGHGIHDVWRRGKWIVMELQPAGFLIWHLGMTGQLTVAPAMFPKADHTHMVLRLDNADMQLRFRDIRRFGSVSYFADRTAVDAFFQQTKLGPEPFDLKTTLLGEQVRKSARNLKAILLDQRVVAGVGNIYADESLFTARLTPFQLGRETSAGEIRRLRKAIVDVLTFAIEKRGSSIRNYIDGSGLKGGYQDEFRVYGRTGQPCRRCNTAIVRVTLAGRSTHYCPNCQPAFNGNSNIKDK